MTFPAQLWAMTPMSMGYINKVLKPNSSIGYDPSSLVGFWPQNEKSGLVSLDHSGLGYHGAYQGVDLGQAGVPGMGMTCPFYDGVNDYNNIYTAGLANDNLLLNPGFETAGAMPPNWANWVDILGDGAIANEVVIVHEGVDSAKLTAGLTQNTNTSQDFAVVPGERRRIRFWSQGDGVNAGRWYLYDVTNTNLITGVTSTGVTAAAWGMVAHEYTVPVGCVLARLYLFCPPVNGGVAYFDACEDRRMNGFLGDKGTIIVPAQVANVGVWTDGLNRHIVTLYSAVAGNYVFIRSGVGNNLLEFRYSAGAVAETVNRAATAELGFMVLGITWDISAGATGQVIAYYQGVQVGAIQTALGTWIGDIQAVQCIVGGYSTVPQLIWSGNIGPVLTFNEAKSPAEMLYLSTP